MIVTFVLPAFNENNCPFVSLGSLLCQTNPNWRAIVFHNGTNDIMRGIVDGFNDGRISYVESPENNGTDTINRQHAFDHLITSEWTVSASIQDYFLPNLVESIMAISDKADFIYWNSMNHLFHDNVILNAHPEPCKIDWGNMAVRTELAKRVGISHHRHHQADGNFALDVMATNPRAVKIDKMLTVHN